MPVRFPTTMPVPDRWVSIDLGPAGSIEVHLLRPTWQQLMQDAEMIAGFVGMRIRNSVCDWRGVTDENDQPIPFSLAALETVCILYPAAAVQIAQQVGILYAGLPDSVEKNSDAPPHAPSPDAEPSLATNGTPE